MMIDDSYFMDYIKQLGKGPGNKNNKTRQDKTKKAEPRRLALAQPQKPNFTQLLQTGFNPVQGLRKKAFSHFDQNSKI